LRNGKVLRLENKKAAKSRNQENQKNQGQEIDTKFYEDFTKIR